MKPCCEASCSSRSPYYWLFSSVIVCSNLMVGLSFFWPVDLVFYSWCPCTMHKTRTWTFMYLGAVLILLLPVHYGCLWVYCTTSFSFAAVVNFLIARYFFTSGYLDFSLNIIGGTFVPLLGTAVSYCRCVRWVGWLVAVFFLSSFAFVCCHPFLGGDFPPIFLFGIRRRRFFWWFVFN